MVDGANGGSGGPSPEPMTPGASTVFTGLAEIIYQGSDPAEVYAAIRIAATLIVPGCDHASLLVRRNDHYVTSTSRCGCGLTIGPKGDGDD
jgi:hypothetical protein